MGPKRLGLSIEGDERVCGVGGVGCMEMGVPLHEVKSTTGNGYLQGEFGAMDADKFAIGNDYSELCTSNTWSVPPSSCTCHNLVPRRLDASQYY
jgi:hypothetical protein